MIEINTEHKLSQDQETHLSDSDRSKLRGRVASIRAFIGSYSQRDVPTIIEYSQQALECLPEQDIAMRTIAAIALGDAYAIQGDMSAAYQAQLNALDIITSTGNVYFLIVANLKLANILRQQGML